MGLSRNKVAVPEGVAGTPPFWSEVRHDGSGIERGKVVRVLPVFFSILRHPAAAKREKIIDNTERKEKR